MKIAMIVIRTLMGLLLIWASVAYFFNLMAAPPNLPQAVIAYNKGLAVAHVMTVAKAVELICGIMLITGRYVKLAIVLLFPIALNIVLFLGFLMPASVAPGVFLLAGDLFLAWYYRHAYEPLLAAK